MERIEIRIVQASLYLRQDAILTHCRLAKIMQGRLRSAFLTTILITARLKDRYLPYHKGSGRNEPHNRNYYDKEYKKRGELARKAHLQSFSKEHVTKNKCLWQ